jgi:hypothetical protein
MAISHTAATRIPAIEVISDAMVEALRGKTGAKRLQIASDLYRSARGMLINHLQATNPDWSRAQVASEAARRLSHGAV